MGVLTKERTWKSCSITYPSFQVNVYYDVIIKEDDVEIGRWTDTIELQPLADVTAYPLKLQNICAASWEGL